MHRPALSAPARLPGSNLVLRHGWMAAWLALAQATPAMAQDQPAGPAVQPPRAPQEEHEAERSQGMLGDWGGLRTRLEQSGISLGLQETSEVLGNVSGGRKTGAVYEGATLMSLQIDTGKALGLAGGTFRASAYQIHGRGLSQNNIGNLNTASNIEATRATRLFELWYEQSMLDGAVSLRVGQQAADLEFAVSEYAGVLINASFGWPTLAAVDLPSGGPAYPLATPGVRLRLEPRPEIAALLGVFSGDPAPAGSGDPQVRNASGTSFTFNRGVFVIGELQYRLNADEGAPGLPGTYKIGAWYNSNRFADQRFDVDGLSLADPASSGVPREHRGDWSVYAVADQLVWRKRGTKDQGIGIFARVVGARSDRNLVDFFVNAGATWKGAIPGREDDTAGIGVTYARTGSRARGIDRDVTRFTGAPFPVRSSEAVLEVTYQAQVTSWLTLQPDFQYVFRPGGGIPDPNDPTGVIGDAAILGLRGVLVF